VYNLKGYKPEDYYESLKTLKRNGLTASPHIVIGLEEGAPVF